MIETNVLVMAILAYLDQNLTKELLPCVPRYTDRSSIYVVRVIMGNAVIQLIQKGSLRSAELPKFYVKS